MGVPVSLRRRVLGVFGVIAALAAADVTKAHELLHGDEAAAPALQHRGLL